MGAVLWFPRLKDEPLSPAELELRSWGERVFKNSPGCLEYLCSLPAASQVLLPC